MQVELDDETRRLCDVRPFQPMLKLIEIPGNNTAQSTAEKVINAQISVLMGKGRLTMLVAARMNPFQHFRKHF